MAGNTKNLVRDAGNLPAPQYYNPTTDAYEYVHGANGGLNVNNYIQTAGGLWVPQKANNNGEALVQLTGSYQRYLTLANAVAVSSTSAHLFNLITHGGLKEDQIRQYKEFKFVLINSLDQALNVTVYTVNKPLGITTFSNGSVIYKESSVLAANNGRLVLQANAGGTGSAIKSVPALRGVHTNLIIEIQSPSAAPTSGSVTIGVEMHG